MKLFGYLLSWACFWLGDFTHRVYSVTGIGYHMYNWLMAISCNTQDRYDIENGPWIPIEEEEESLNSSDKM